MRFWVQIVHITRVYHPIYRHVNMSLQNSSPSKKLLDQVRDVIRLKHYSKRTEQTYMD
jgi:hypothetical protein